MAVTKARSDDFTPSPHGATGGLAPEGTGLANVVGKGSPLGGVENARVLNEGVAQRSAKDDEARFHEAEKFQKSKVEFDKKLAQAQKAVAEGKDENPVKEALAKEAAQREAEAAKKPTAPGGETQLNNPAVAQPAKETAKEEAAAVEKKAK